MEEITKQDFDRLEAKIDKILEISEKIASTPEVIKEGAKNALASGKSLFSKLTTKKAAPTPETKSEAPAETPKENSNEIK